MIRWVRNNGIDHGPIKEEQGYVRRSHYYPVIFQQDMYEDDFRSDRWSFVLVSANSNTMEIYIQIVWYRQEEPYALGGRMTRLDNPSETFPVLSADAFVSLTALLSSDPATLSQCEISNMLVYYDFYTSDDSFVNNMLAFDGLGTCRL